MRKSPYNPSKCSYSSLRQLLQHYENQPQQCCFKIITTNRNISIKTENSSVLKPNTFLNNLKNKNNIIQNSNHMQKQKKHLQVKKVKRQKQSNQKAQLRNDLLDSVEVTFKALQYKKNEGKLLNFHTIAQAYFHKKQKSFFEQNDYIQKNNDFQQSYDFPEANSFSGKKPKHYQPKKQQHQQRIQSKQFNNKITKQQYNQVCSYLESIKIDILSKLNSDPNQNIEHKLFHQVSQKLADKFQNNFKQNSRNINIQNDCKLKEFGYNKIQNKQQCDKSSCLFSFDEMINNRIDPLDLVDNDNEYKKQREMDILSDASPGLIKVSQNKKEKDVSNSMCLEQLIQSIKQGIIKEHDKEVQMYENESSENIQNQKSVNSFIHEQQEEIKNNDLKIEAVGQWKKQGKICEIQLKNTIKKVDQEQGQFRFGVKFLQKRTQRTQVIRVSPFKMRRKQQIVQQLVKDHIISKQSNSIVFQ